VLTFTRFRRGLTEVGLTAWVMGQQKVSFTLAFVLDGLESASAIDL